MKRHVNIASAERSRGVEIYLFLLLQTNKRTNTKQNILLFLAPPTGLTRCELLCVGDTVLSTTANAHTITQQTYAVHERHVIQNTKCGTTMLLDNRLRDVMTVFPRQPTHTHTHNNAKDINERHVILGARYKLRSIIMLRDK